jgi:hypothetical protein
LSSHQSQRRRPIRRERRSLPGFLFFQRKLRDGDHRHRQPRGGIFTVATIQKSNADGGDELTSKSGSVFASVTITYTLPYTGSFLIGITTLETGGAGEYGIEMTCSTSGAQDECHANGTLRVGSTISGQLSATDDSFCFTAGYSKVYELEVTQGVPVLITYTTSFAPRIEAEVNEGPGVFKTSADRCLSTPRGQPLGGGPGDVPEQIARHALQERSEKAVTAEEPDLGRVRSICLQVARELDRVPQGRVRQEAPVLPRRENDERRPERFLAMAFPSEDENE